MPKHWLNMLLTPAGWLVAESVLHRYGDRCDRSYRGIGLLNAARAFRSAFGEQDPLGDIVRGDVQALLLDEMEFGGAEEAVPDLTADELAPDSALGLPRTCRLAVPFRDEDDCRGVLDALSPADDRATPEELGQALEALALGLTVSSPEAMRNWNADWLRTLFEEIFGSQPKRVEASIAPGTSADGSPTRPVGAGCPEEERKQTTAIESTQGGDRGLECRA